MEDDEFGRQAIAGINPLSIEKLTVFPPVSKIEPLHLWFTRIGTRGGTYNRPSQRHVRTTGTTMKEKIVGRHGLLHIKLRKGSPKCINGCVLQALHENKLFILDYHDIFLPFLDQINAFDDRKTYGTRTILFLTSMGTLKPIAIELSSSATNSVSPSQQVLTPPVDATTNWLWQLGKVHVCSNDACVHQLVHHWYAHRLP